MRCNVSIASNVILENTRLGAVRTKLRNKLTEYNIWWDNTLTIFELAERLMLMFGVAIVSTVKSNTITPGGFEYSVTLQDSGVPVDWWINGVHSVVRTDSNGKSSITVAYVQDATGTVVSKVGRKVAIDISYTCVRLQVLMIMHGITILEAMTLSNIHQTFHTTLQY
jgi:hypothetical protein